MLAQACPAEGASIATDGITVTGKDQQVVLFASVPLTDEPWTPLEQGHVVMVADGEECGIDRS
jgi:glutamine amidotransferase